MFVYLLCVTAMQWLVSVLYIVDGVYFIWISPAKKMFLRWEAEAHFGLVYSLLKGSIGEQAEEGAGAL